MSSPIVHSVLREITPDLQARLNELTQGLAGYGRSDSLSSAARAILVDIASLQVKAKRTFGEHVDGSAWWVTRRGLQQATQHRVAALKAAWMGDAIVADVCSGLGSDLIALARRGPVIGIDLDADVLAFADANLRSVGAQASLHNLDVTSSAVQQVLGGARFLHIDPDRRVEGRRRTEADCLVPSWARVCELLQACDGGAVKLAPATALAEHHTGDFHRTWISVSGSVREQTAIYGDLLSSYVLQKNVMTSGTRSAIVIRKDRTDVFSPGAPADCVAYGNASAGSNRGLLGAWLIDPDAAIRAAGLTQAYADAVGARPVDSAAGFLTADAIDASAPELAMAIVGRVIDVVGCDDRKLRRYFRAHDGYPETIKARGVDVDPAVLTRRMKDCGQNPFGLWIGRQGKRTYAAITAPA